MQLELKAEMWTKKYFQKKEIFSEKLLILDFGQQQKKLY